MFHNRTDAGKKLAEALSGLKNARPVVITIPRGGLPVGAAIAAALDAPLDIALAKKIGHPLNREFAIGAVSPEHLIVEKPQGISGAYLEDEVQRLRKTLESRHALFYKKVKPLSLTGRTVILTDDGMATGNTLRVTAKLIASAQPEKVVVAVPVGPPESVRRLEEMDEVDEVICLETPHDFMAVGQYYKEFPQVTDQTALVILEKNRARIPD